MKVILQKNVETLGAVGQVVQVKNGYARNYLIPNGLATSATEANVRTVERQHAKQIALEKVRRTTAEGLAARISELAVVIEANAGEDDKLFGSIQSQDIQEALARAGIEVDKKDILVKQPIRKTGVHSVEVRCYTNFKAPLKITVTRKK